MRPIALEDLREQRSQSKRRTSREVTREYREKYDRLIEAFDAEDRGLTVDQVRALEVLSAPVQMSLGSKLYEADRREALEVSLMVHMDAIVQYGLDAASIVDLGCGYGYLLHRLRPTLGCETKLWGGDASTEAVLLAERLRIANVVYFDFHAARYEPLAMAPGPVVVVTSFALHQLATAGPVIETLSRYREKIAYVICLEPEENKFGDSPLGRKRLRYQLDNDYSADLLSCLEKRKDIEIVFVVPNAVGANALLPGTLSVWRFK